LYNHPRIPLRQVDLKKATGMGYHPLDYHLGPLMENGVIIQSENEKGTKLYLLSDMFYDDTFIEGLEISLTDLAKVISAMLNTEDIEVVLANMKNAVDLFCIAYR
jgi:hypothetical protein